MILEDGIEPHHGSAENERSKTRETKPDDREEARGI